MVWTVLSLDIRIKGLSWFSFLGKKLPLLAYWDQDYKVFSTDEPIPLFFSNRALVILKKSVGFNNWKNDVLLTNTLHIDLIPKSI